jgi:hypothetical protein
VVVEKSVLTNEENLNSGSEDHFIKFGTANLAGEDKRKKVCGSLFVKKLMGGCN